MSLPALFLATVLIAAPAEAEEVTARISYVTQSGLFVDAGRDRGLRAGDEGSVMRGGREIARVEIKAVSSSSCQATFVLRLPDAAPQSGDTVVFRIQRPTAPVEPPPSAAGDPGVTTEPAPSASREGEEFVPLLAPWDRPETARVRPIFHGNVRAGTQWIQDQEYDRDYGYHQLSSSGAGDRLFGGAWSLEWSLNANVRTGSGYDGHPDDGEIKLRTDQFLLRHHAEDGTVVGVGRVLPLALPAFGRLDGAYVEKPLEDGFRLGAIAGLRPERDDLGFSTDDFVVGAYGAYQTEWSEEWSLWMTPGVLASWYKGAADQHALLLDAGLRDRSGTFLNFSSQADYYTGSEETRSGLDLTRITLSGGVPLGDVFSVRGYWHRFELPDTESQRALIPSDLQYRRGHQRLAGTLIERFGDLGLEQEVAQLSGAGSDTDLQFTGRAYLGGLPLMGTADVSAYTIAGADSEGFGAQAGYGAMPFDRLYARLAASYNSIEPDGFSEQSFTDVSLQLDWQMSMDTTLSSRVAYNFGDNVDALLWDLSLTWRF